MNKLTYKDAGVNIDAGNKMVENMKPFVNATKRPELLGSLGGFAAAMEIPKGYKKPVLISGTDGVGTKLKLAIDWQDTSTLGTDLVAMCVNDLLVTGAEPLFFLDYYATGQLVVEDGIALIKNLAQACLQAGCSLVGGETAEMPGLYAKGDFDLAGFAVGIVEKDKMQSPDKIKAGDLVLGIASSGAHANGYSLVRKILANRKIQADDELEAGVTFKQALLAPTKIYVKSLLPLLQKGLINGLSHITGGGFYENIPRILPSNLGVELDFSNYQLPSLFKFLQRSGKIEMAEMLRTFNCGFGMVAIVSPEERAQVVNALRNCGEEVMELGKVVDLEESASQVNIVQMPK